MYMEENGNMCFECVGYFVIICGCIQWLVIKVHSFSILHR